MKPPKRVAVAFSACRRGVPVKLGGLLKHYQAQMTTCQSGLAAYDLIAGKSHNLLIVDIQMPQVSGWDLIKAVRAHPDPPVNKLPVIALTARVQPKDKEALLQAGYDHYFRKPPVMEDFLTCLESYAS
jgi:CheY-like chemotaxis protein